MNENQQGNGKHKTKGKTTTTKETPGSSWQRILVLNYKWVEVLSYLISAMHKMDFFSSQMKLSVVFVTHEVTDAKVDSVFRSPVTLSLRYWNVVWLRHSMPISPVWAPLYQRCIWTSKDPCDWQARCGHRGAHARVCHQGKDWGLASVRFNSEGIGCTLPGRPAWLQIQWRMGDKKQNKKERKGTWDEVCAREEGERAQAFLSQALGRALYEHRRVLSGENHLEAKKAECPKARPCVRSHAVEWWGWASPSGSQIFLFPQVHTLLNARNHTGAVGEGGTVCRLRNVETGVISKEKLESMLGKVGTYVDSCRWKKWGGGRFPTFLPSRILNKDPQIKETLWPGKSHREICIY